MFILQQETDITVSGGNAGNSPKVLDYIIIQKLSETVDFTLGADGGESYKSYIPAQAVDFSATGVTAYVASAYADGSVTLTEVTAVPADVPVLLKGTKGSSVEIVPTSATISAPTDNLLVAAAAEGTAIASTDNKYVLGYNSSAWKFGHFNGTLPSGKVYLDLSSSESRPASVSIRFSDDEATGLSQVENERPKTEDPVFNLQGQRVAKATKGLYIVNGKKIIVK